MPLPALPEDVEGDDDAESIGQAMGRVRSESIGAGTFGTPAAVVVGGAAASECQHQGDVESASETTV